MRILYVAVCTNIYIYIIIELYNYISIYVESRKLTCLTIRMWNCICLNSHMHKCAYNWIIISKLSAYTYKLWPHNPCYCGLNPSEIRKSNWSQSQSYLRTLQPSVRTSHALQTRERKPMLLSFNTLKDVYWPDVPGVAHHAHHMSCLSTNETQHRILEQTILYSIDCLPISRAICLADEFHQFCFA